VAVGEHEGAGAVAGAGEAGAEFLIVERAVGAQLDEALAIGAARGVGADEAFRQAGDLVGGGDEIEFGRRRGGQGRISRSRTVVDPERGGGDRDDEGDQCEKETAADFSGRGRGRGRGRRWGGLWRGGGRKGGVADEAADLLGEGAVNGCLGNFESGRDGGPGTGDDRGRGERANEGRGIFGQGQGRWRCRLRLRCRLRSLGVVEKRGDVGGGEFDVGLLGVVGGAEEQRTRGGKDDEAAAFDGDDELGVAVDEFDGGDGGEFFEQFGECCDAEAAEFGGRLVGADGGKIGGDLAGRDAEGQSAARRRGAGR